MAKPVRFAKLATHEIRDAGQHYRLIRRDLLVRFIGEAWDEVKSESKKIFDSLRPVTDLWAN